MAMRAAPFLLLLSLFGCSFDPNIPSARVLCQRANDCPRGFLCEPVQDPALAGVSVCCQQRGCSRGLDADELRRIAQAAMERTPDGGSDVPRACGNGKVEQGETCDPPSSCPTSCPAIGCTRRQLEGSAASCTARCVDDGQQTACTAGDSCCPAGCADSMDGDCNCTCGNGMREEACGETCDPLRELPHHLPARGLQAAPDGQPRHLPGRLRATTGPRPLASAATAAAQPAATPPTTATARPPAATAPSSRARRCDPAGGLPHQLPGDRLHPAEAGGRGRTCTARCVDAGKQTTCAQRRQLLPGRLHHRQRQRLPAAPAATAGVEEACGETCDPAGQLPAQPARPWAASCASWSTAAPARPSAWTTACRPPAWPATAAARPAATPPTTATAPPAAATARSRPARPATRCPAAPPAAPGWAARRRKLEGTADPARPAAWPTAPRPPARTATAAAPRPATPPTTTTASPAAATASVEGNEACDGDCPTACPTMGCQRRKLQGSAAPVQRRVRGRHDDHHLRRRRQLLRLGLHQRQRQRLQLPVRQRRGREPPAARNARHGLPHQLPAHGLPARTLQGTRMHWPSA